MNKFYLSAIIVALSAHIGLAQTNSQPTSQRQPVSQNQKKDYDFPNYGVRIEPDDRLIIVMAALDAAGFNSTANTPFHQELRQDLTNLDPDLRRRLRDFFLRSNRGLENATLTDQAARYVSLAYALGPAPQLAAPTRSSDLPAGLLEVLDFAPLVQEFYQKSGISEKLLQYKQKHQNFGNSLRSNIEKTVSDVASYLNTRPQLVAVERVVATPTKTTTDKNNKKAAPQPVKVREMPRSFYVVPDLLAAPNSVKLRVIGEDYFAIIGSKVKPESSSELRRAYLQFLIDPLIYKNAKEISVQREAIRGLLDELNSKKQKESDALKKTQKTDEDATLQITVSPDPFLATARSLIVAAEIRERKQKYVQQLTREAQAAAAKSQRMNGEEVAVVNNRLTFPKAEAEAFAELAEAYEMGAVLVFFFDEQLRGLESSGFDVASSFPDMIASFDASKEKARLKESETKRQQAIIELAERRQTAAKPSAEDESAAKASDAEFVASLSSIESLLKTKDYETAESRLKDLLLKYPGEPRLLFALGRTASLSAQNVFDESLRDERLKKAATHYVNLLKLSTPDTTPPALLSNTHVALAKIYEFYADENAVYRDAALKELDAAIALGDIKDGAYREAVAGKERLTKNNR